MRIGPELGQEQSSTEPQGPRTLGSKLSKSRPRGLVQPTALSRHGRRPLHLGRRPPRLRGQDQPPPTNIGDWQEDFFPWPWLQLQLCFLGPEPLRNSCEMIGRDLLNDDGENVEIQKMANLGDFIMERKTKRPSQKGRGK